MVRSPIVLCLALPACGLVPSSDTIVPFPSDGASVFEDAEPIEVCLGPARVVPPGAPSGAVCVLEGASAKACSADSACAGIERCVCGRCIVEACAGGGACGEGRVCRDKRCTTSCTMDVDCSEGEVCAAGGCARACAGDGDCHFGERCDKLGNACRAKPCSPLVPCGPGARCEEASIPGELREPEVVSVGGAPVAFVELRAGGSRAIYRARVDASTRWTIAPIEPVVGPDAGAPSTLVDGSRVEMYFAIGDGAGIGRAVSTDGGLTFAKDESPVLVPAAPWENGRVGSPSVVRHQGSTYLFYEGGSREGVGLARVDGAVAARSFEDPISTPTSVGDPLFWHHVTQVGAPAAISDGEVVRLYFTARGAEGTDALVGDAAAPAEANDSIGLLASLDMKRFALRPTGPVLARLTNLRTYLGEREASVRARGDGGTEITFVASDASGERMTGLATARTPGAVDPR